jgi:hypothetical protein
MDLFEALKLVQHGRAVTRKLWKNPSCHVKLVPDTNMSPFQTVHIFVPEKNTYDKWLMCSEDLDAEDWEETAAVAIPAAEAAASKLDIKRLPIMAAKNTSPVPKKA